MNELVELKTELKVELKGVATKKALKELIALEGFAKTLGELGCTDAQRVIDDIVRQAKASLISLPGVYEDESVILEDPADIAKNFREAYNRKTVMVRNCKICRGRVFGSYTILKGSQLAIPRKSLPKNVKKIRDILLQEKKISSSGEVLSDIELNSRNVIACLATGAATNANRVLSDL